MLLGLLNGKHIQSSMSTLLCQVVLNEVQGRQVAINNRAGNSNGQVDALLGHVDSLLSSNNHTLFRPSDAVPPAIISPGYDP